MAHVLENTVPLLLHLGFCIETGHAALQLCGLCTRCHPSTFYQNSQRMMEATAATAKHIMYRMPVG